MKIRIFLLILALICYFSFTSCGNGRSEDEEAIAEVADSFATKYYYWRFKDAMQFSTESCQQYLRFLCSNVHEADLDALHESEIAPEITIGNITIKSDTEADIEVKLKNVFLMDTLGTRAHINPETTQTFTMHKSADSWKVASVYTKQ